MQEPKICCERTVENIKMNSLIDVEGKAYLSYYASYFGF